MKLPHIAGALALVCSLAFSTTATANKIKQSGTDVHGISSSEKTAGHADSGRPSAGDRRISKRKRAHSRNRAIAHFAKVDLGPLKSSAAWSGSDVVAEARRYIGGNPTGWNSLWCARFMNLVLERTGHKPSGSNQASSFAHYGRRISGPQIGAIAVMSRKGGGHVGVVTGVDAGSVTVISGNHNRRVAEAKYPRWRVYAYVLPAGI